MKKLYTFYPVMRIHICYRIYVVRLVYEIIIRDVL